VVAIAQAASLPLLPLFKKPVTVIGLVWVWIAAGGSLTGGLHHQPEGWGEGIDLPGRRRNAARWQQVALLWDRKAAGGFWQADWLTNQVHPWCRLNTMAVFLRWLIG
jgi:hypothetical protein